LYEYQASGEPPGIWAHSYSLKKRKAQGQSFLVATQASRPSVALDGTLVYLGYPAFRQMRLVWRDRKGTYVGQLIQLQRAISEPAISPDGRFVAVSAKEGGNPDIWVHDIARGIKTRLTFDHGDDSRPIWSPDGKKIVFSRGHSDLFLTPSDGSAPERILLGSPARESVDDWSQDGKYIVYSIIDARSVINLWYFRLSENTGIPQSRPFSQTRFNETAGRLSPDGRFLAYCSNESGAWEVYIRSFPDGRSKIQVSTKGGSQPRWNRNGKELFYVEGDTLIAISVATSPVLSARRSKRLFQHSHLRHLATFARYDVSPDGQRFLLFEPSGVEPSQDIRVVQNWFAEFRN
jgi:Tol biopolymer transport system component